MLLLFAPGKIVNEQVDEQPSWKAVQETNTGLHTVILYHGYLPLRVIVF